MFTATEMATAIHHRIPLTAVVFNDGAYGNVRRNQEERFGNRIIASDLSNPDFVRLAESFGAAAERARNPVELRAALKDTGTLELRQRLERLLERVESGTPETLRAIRAVEALEHIATPAARQHLTALAGGAAGTALTDAAAAALKRMER